MYVWVGVGWNISLPFSFANGMTTPRKISYAPVRCARPFALFVEKMMRCGKKRALDKLANRDDYESIRTKVVCTLMVAKLADAVLEKKSETGCLRVCAPEKLAASPEIWPYVEAYVYVQYGRSGSVAWSECSSWGPLMQLVAETGIIC